MVRLTVLAAAALAAAALGVSGATAAVPPVTWCGTEPSAVDRLPDTSGGFEWHVVYAFPSDGTDRFAALAGGIATDLASIDAWWNGQDPTRRIRFDLFAFPGCSPGFGQLDLTRAQLPRPGSDYQSLGGRLERVVSDLDAAPFGLGSPDKKYLVYYDGPIDDDSICGQGNAGLIDGGPRAFALVFLQACGQASPGDGEGAAAITAAHEMTHAFNALPAPLPSPGPPHVCSSSDQGHPCDNVADLLYPVGSATDTLSTRILDFNRDDYYGHSGPWWDVQDSPFLVRVGDPDQQPPAGPRSLLATSDGLRVRLSWPKATDDVGPVGYRVYKNGALAQVTTATTLEDGSAPGATIRYGVRSYDPAGHLSPLVEVLFKVGVGIVDADGKLVKDTVAPTRVTGLRARLVGGKLVLRWKPARDAGGLRGYVVERNGKRYRLVTGRTITVPAAKARAAWSVRAVDRAGNLGARFQSVRVG
jgi:hypothetical protein